MHNPDAKHPNSNSSPDAHGVVPLPASKILILTHDAGDVEKLKEIIEHTWEIPVVVATDAEHAIVDFHRMHPDLIVLDHAEAAHFLWQVRQDRRPDGFLPALVLAANEDAKLRQEVMMAGATDFLAKPVDVTEAMMRIHNLLSLREARQGLATAAPAAEQALVTDHRLVQLREKEASLAPPDRLHVIGTMASGIAHDFNNILMLIRGTTEQLLHEGQSLLRTEREDLLRAIVTAARDGAEMVERLREYHAPASAEQVYQAVHLNQLVEQCVALTKPKWHAEARTRGANIEVEQALAETPPIHGHPAQLRQVLINLIFNAVDAMPGGGALSLSTTQQGGEVVLEVRDSGTGMTDRVRQHCREPFFSTKGHQGAGMGLAMVQAIAERHGAQFDMQSEVGQGTVCHLRFHEAGSAPSSPKGTETEQVGSLDILVVDDEPMVCELTKRLLSDAGHHVRATTDAHEALRLSMAEPFDLVVTDRSMPLMNGESLAAAIKTGCPSTRILLVTGSGRDEVARGNIDAVLTKPFTRDALQYAVTNVFATPAQKPARNNSLASTR